MITTRYNDHIVQSNMPLDDNTVMTILDYISL